MSEQAAAEPFRRPPGFPADGESTVHRALLDAAVSGPGPAPPCAERLALPGPDHWSPGTAGALVDAGPDLAWRAGVVFGGYLACVADLFAGFAVMTVLPDDYGFLTADLDTVFHAPAAPGPISVLAAVQQLSRRRALVTVRMHQDGRLTVGARATQLLIHHPDPQRTPLAAGRAAAV
ncbi:MAG TPA: PaaI family thioesterase [Actinocrinis sp.]|nr:PaaI family thioesterase [Actinocrinis sp.]